jgi:hypothetical protein
MSIFRRVEFKNEGSKKIKIMVDGNMSSSIYWRLF